MEATGQILVSDPDAGTDFRGALFRVDPVSGARTLLNNLGVGVNPGRAPVGVAVVPAPALVIDRDGGTGFRGALVRVDLSTGGRTVLSDFGVGANLGFDPSSLAVEASGQVVALDPSAGTGGKGALFRVNPVGGLRTLVSDFGVGANLGFDPSGVAVEGSGQLVVIDPAAGTTARGNLVRVHPTTGVRTLVVNFGSGTPLGNEPLGIAVEGTGKLVVADADAGTGLRGALLRFDPAAAVRTLLSDFGVGATLGVEPRAVAVSSSGDLFVLDRSAGSFGLGALFGVNAGSGLRTLLHDFGDFGSGVILGETAAGVAVEASGHVLVIDEDAGTDFDGALFRVNLTTGLRTVVSDFGRGRNQGLSPSGVALVRIPRLLNSGVSFAQTGSPTTAPNAGLCAPSFTHTLSFTARLTNIGTRILGTLVTEVRVVSNNNLLQNAEGGPAGVGARRTVPLTGSLADGGLSANEFVDVPLVLCLTNLDPFSLRVNVLGVGL